MSVTHRVEAKLARIAAMDAAIGAFTHLHADAARGEAGRIEAGGSDGPLAGMTFAVKDNIAVAGSPWTGGLAGRRTVLAEGDAPVVSRLRQAGCILLGQLNQHEGALGGTTDNPAYGRTVNPLGAGLTPGGSSGGSGAAVAAGFVDIALGSDTMGSVRLPAAYCGIFGLKPTFGAVPRSGFLYLAPSLDTIGPLTSDPSLLWPALLAMAGRDDGDDGAQTARFETGVPKLSGRRFGVPRQLSDVPFDSEVATAFQRVRTTLSALGTDIVEIDLPGWSPSGARRAGLLICEVEGAAEMADLLDRPDAMSSALASMLRYGRDADPARVDGARETIRAARDAWLSALEQVDAILMPTAPQRAFAFDGPHPVDQADLTAPANFAGCPAVAFPVPAGGLPASVQIIGPPWSDRRLCGWAEALASHPYG